jgi:hypothetical protein
LGSRSSEKLPVETSEPSSSSHSSVVSIDKIDSTEEWLEELGSDVSTGSFSDERDPKILFLVVVRTLFFDSRYWACKNDRRGEDQRKSGELKMLISEFSVNWLEEGVTLVIARINYRWRCASPPSFSNG